MRQFCSYQSKSGHSQWTLKPSKMARTVGKAWSRRPRPQTGGAQPPVLLRLSHLPAHTYPVCTDIFVGGIGHFRGHWPYLRSPFLLVGNRT